VTEVDQFLSEGIVSLPCDGIQGLIEPVMSGFGALIEDAAVHPLWKIVDPDAKDPEFGLVVTPGDPDKDEKFTFHYREGLFAQLEDLHESELGKRVLWIASCNLLYMQCYIRALALARELDERLPGLQLRQSVIRAKDQHVLRLNWYAAPTRIGQEIGKLHEDRSCWSFGVAENTPGFIANDVVRRAREGRVTLFGGTKFAELTGNRVTPARHGYISQSLKQRWSVVFFVHTL